MPSRAASPRPSNPRGRVTTGLGRVGLGRVGLAAGLAWISGCAEPPAYEVRWRLIDEAGLADPSFEAATELRSVKQCADVGVMRVRVTTRYLDNRILDVREYPCFPSVFGSGGAVEVPALPSGEYQVEVRGLRRTGDPWVCVDDPNTPEVEPCVAWAKANVTVAEDSLPIVEVVLLRPPECDDGIDNDRDGRVDGKDPACILDPTGPESADSGATLFQLSVSFLASEVVRPANVGVTRLDLSVDGELFAQLPATQLDTSQWPFRMPLLSGRFDAGTHQFTLQPVGPDGTAKTLPFEREFMVNEDAAGFLLEHVEFELDSFVEPIIEPIAATAGLLLNPGDQTGPLCTLGGLLGGAPVTIERVGWRVTDALDQDQPLDAATLALSGSAGGAGIEPVDEADGWVSFACPSSVVSSVPLTWGSYQIEIRAQIGDVVCFRSDGVEELAPVGQAGAQSFTLDRVVDDQGAPPPGCEECEVDSDCSGQICDAGICKDNQP